MKLNSKWIIAGIVLSVVLLAGACSAGFMAGWAYAPVAKASAGALPTSSSSTDTQTLFKPFWEAWKIVHDYYIKKPLDDVKLMQGAIRGMMQALGDKHSSYLDPIQYQDANRTFTGEYGGIGAWVNVDGDYLTIAELMADSPAQKAGLLPGDKIIGIDGADMTGVDPVLAHQKVIGKAGTQVVLKIQRQGVDQPFDVTITRAIIKVPSVSSKMLDGNIAYVKISNFGDKTTDELRTALKDLLKNKPVGLIVDLRNNPGGELTTAVNVGSEFLSKGVVLYEEYGDGTRKTYDVKPGGLATDIPLVVLVNQYSASASELVAGAIQDDGRGTLVGMTTYGKGTVQNWIPLSDNQGAVRVTIARWLTPKERNITDVGLTPDVKVDLTAEDVKANKDPQLDKAVEILKQK